MFGKKSLENLPKDESKEKKLTKFLNDTKTGKFTDQKPVIADLVFSRYEITDECINLDDDFQANEVLFGLT